MSDFSDRIRDARGSARPAESVLAHGPPGFVEVPPHASVLSADNGKRNDAPDHRGPSDAALEQQRRMVEELSRKIDALNAAVLQEILRHPGAAVDYPRTIAVLADELAERATSGTPEEMRQHFPGA